MAKALTMEEVQILRKKSKDAFIKDLVYECRASAHKFITDREDNYSSFWYKKTVPTKYKDIETELYASLKDMFPDFTVIVNVSKKYWLCYWRYYEARIEIKWG